MKKTKTQELFSPLKVGDVMLGHRVVMAPLTRMRSRIPGDVPSDLMAEYYGQRASEGGLIITEATMVSTKGNGYLGAPGIYNEEQTEAWKKIVQTVHSKGGLIFSQLWHAGRVSHKDLSGGDVPIAPSVVPFEGTVFTQTGWVGVSTARELKIEEIPSLIQAYRLGLEHAHHAGFDGIELHAANGYLLDQFLQDGSNQRKDQYGGSIENRARLLLDIVDALIPICGAGKIGVRISPSSKFNSMFDSDPSSLFAYVGRELDKRGLAYVHVIEPRVNGSDLIGDAQKTVAANELRQVFKGPIMAAGGFEPVTAEAVVEKGDADFVAFGRHFIANPDLPLRIKLGLPLNPYDRSTFYGGTEKGYIDYPFCQPAAGHAA